MSREHAPSQVPLPGHLVPFAWGALGAKLRGRLALGDGAGAVLREAAWRVALQGVNQWTWALDDLMAPGWRRVRIKGPLFIVGHQRSGTTFLHRTLVEDALVGAYGLPLAHMILPSVLLQRAARRVPRPLRARLSAREEALFSPLDVVHRIRFGAIEEDEFALWSIFASAMCANDGPSTAAAPALEALRRPEQRPALERRQAMGWYRACLQKNIAVHGAGSGLVVAKNPAFGKRIPELVQAFPDARFVHLVRNPLQAIPSRLSLIQAIWRLRVPGFDRLSSAHVEAITSDSARIYDETRRGLDALPSERQLEVRFEDFIGTPVTVIERIAMLAEVEVRPGLATALHARSAERARTKGPREHRYQLEDFGLDESAIRARCAGTFARYGW